MMHVMNTCGDSHLKTKESRGYYFNPLLKLTHNMPLMFVTNAVVSNGHTNRTRVKLQAVAVTEVPIPSKISIEGEPCTNGHINKTEDAIPNKISIYGELCTMFEARHVHLLLRSLDRKTPKLFKTSPNRSHALQMCPCSSSCLWA